MKFEIIDHNLNGSHHNHLYYLFLNYQSRRPLAWNPFCYAASLLIKFSEIITSMMTASLYSLSKCIGLHKSSICVSWRFWGDYFQTVPAVYNSQHMGLQAIKVSTLYYSRCLWTSRSLFLERVYFYDQLINERDFFQVSTNRFVTPNLVWLGGKIFGILGHFVSVTSKKSLRLQNRFGTFNCSSKNQI